MDSLALYSCPGVSFFRFASRKRGTRGYLVGAEAEQELQRTGKRFALVSTRRESTKN